MKKLLVVGTLILSAGAFAAGGHSGHSGNGKKVAGNNNGCTMMGGKTGGRMMANLTPEQQKVMQRDMIAIQEKQLEVRKAMAEDKVDWNKVEKLNKEVANLRATHKTQMMKYMAENPQTVPAKQ